MQRIVAVAIAALAAGCVPSRVATGVVYATTAPSPIGDAAPPRPLADARVEWRCPGEAPRVVGSDERGRFDTGPLAGEVRAGCTLVVSKPGYATFRAGAAQLCPDPSACSAVHAYVLLHGAEPWTEPLSRATKEPAKATDIETMLEVVVERDGTRSLGGAPMHGDAALAAAAREALRKDPGARVLLKADASVSYSQLVLTIDALKRAGVAHIALGSPRAGSSATAASGSCAPAPALEPPSAPTRAPAPAPASSKPSFDTL